MADKPSQGPPEIKPGVGSSPLDYLLFLLPPVGLANALIKEQRHIDSIQEHQSYIRQRNNDMVFQRLFGVTPQQSAQTQGVQMPQQQPRPAQPKTTQPSGQTAAPSPTQPQPARGPQTQGTPPGMDVTGMSYSPEKGGFTNITFGRRQEAVDNQFFSLYQRTLQGVKSKNPHQIEETSRREAFFRTYEQLGQLPSDSMMENLFPDWQEERKGLYFQIQQALARDDSFREIVRSAVPGLSGQALENLINRAAHMATKAELNGYAPEDVEEEFVKSTFAKREFEGLDGMLQKMGIDPAAATPEDIGRAMQESMRMRVQEAGETKAAQIGAEYAMEASKPISAENRAKYGIGAEIPTYTDLANQGFRFPTEADRKIYATLAPLRQEFQDFEDMLLGEDGVFTGIGDNLVQRKSAQASLAYAKAKGTRRGQNLELYQDWLASLARRLLALAGESGGRFTDVDVQQIMRSAPDPGGMINAVDSEKLARRKLDKFLVEIGRRLHDIHSTTAIKPMGQPTPETPGVDPERLREMEEALKGMEKK